MPRIPTGNPAEETNFLDKFARNWQGFVSRRNCFTFNHIPSSSAKVSKNHLVSLPKERATLKEQLISKISTHAQNISPARIPHILGFIVFVLFVFNQSDRQWGRQHLTIFQRIRLVWLSTAGSPLFFYPVLSGF